jgi:SAM-dependent methyltransferase
MQIKTTQSALHKHYEAQGGVTAVFSSKVADYVASRPDYPAALFHELATYCRLPDGAHIADIGAGTGLLTRDLLACGYRVTAIEPNPEMREACDHLLGHLSGYRSESGTAESMSLDDLSVDLITAATAFHWFKINESRSECLRVLKPRANVALIWNDRVLTDPLHVALGEVFAQFGGAKRDALVAHQERQGVPSFFGDTTAHEFVCAHTHDLSCDGLLSLVFSRSYMPLRDTDVGQLASDSVRRVFDRFAVNGCVGVRYNTVAYIGRPT